MDCVTCRDHFTTLLEGGGSTDAIAAREHLDTCEACTRHFEGFQTTVKQLRSLPVVSPPPALFSQISAALDDVAPRKPLWQSYWQPVTATASLAACVMLVVWTMVLSPVNVTPYPQSSPLINTISQPIGMNAPGIRAPQGMPYPTAGMPQRPQMGTAGPRPMAGRRQLSPRPQMPARPQAQRSQQFPEFGSWGSRLASASPTASGPAGAATFSDPGDAVQQPRPLQRTAGEVQVSFIPPAERMVGVPGTGQVVVLGEAEAEIVIRVQPGAGLRVKTAEDGVLYRGPLRKGEKLQVPITMVAMAAGRKQLRLKLEADVAGVAADLEVLVPAFAGEASVAAESQVTLVFRDTPSARAIRDMAAAAGERVVLHEGVNGQLVSHDYSAGVPFKVALKVLCDGCGYRIEEKDGVYHIHVK